MISLITNEINSINDKIVELGYINVDKLKLKKMFDNHKIKYYFFIKIFQESIKKLSLFSNCKIVILPVELDEDNRHQHLVNNKRFDNLIYVCPNELLHNNFYNYQKLLKQDKKICFVSQSSINYENVNHFYYNGAWFDVFDCVENISRHNYSPANKRFLILGGMPRLNKIYTLNLLYKNQILENSLWSCSKIQKNDLFSINQGFKTTEDNLKNTIKSTDYNIDSFLKITPKIIDCDSNDKKVTTNIKHTINLYCKTPISIVLETDSFDNEHQTRYTEKSIRPIIQGQIFLISGSKSTLKKLQDDGFRTFHPFIDESYDTKDNFVDRVDALMTEIIKINKMTESEFIVFLEKVSPIIDYNLKYLKQQLNNLSLNCIKSILSFYE